ncbi:helix-turn-helix domain-containing protein, partial [Bifidobacterium longum]|nr:helix-turn-helix domain-containing protein [Bifidobacterium longum]MDB6658902.1 helix-turn-helix domain-containing protein [Bifidobacterium longum]MDB6715092.1 helix-turn-helix domain-containing protein [Bifidobacterium longum]
MHSHLSEEERQIIQIEIDNGTSIRRIAGLIGRHASTVSREIVLLQCLLGGFGSVFPQHPIEHIHTPTPSWTGSYTTPPSWKPANTTCANTRPSGSRPPKKKRTGRRVLVIVATPDLPQGGSGDQKPPKRR